MEYMSRFVTQIIYFEYIVSRIQINIIGGKSMDAKIKPDHSILGITDKCCDATTGCEWDGTLRRVVTEPIYVQKVYDATLVNQQGLSTLNNVVFSPNLPEGARILNILSLKCKKFFNPSNINDPRNFVIDTDTMLSGGEFLKNECGDYVEVIGPDGLSTERLIYADTSECDEVNKGTPVFGTQKIRIRGNILIEVELLILDARGRRVRYKISANVPITPINAPIILTSFFELCIPSVFDSAFFPRFTEFCNALCETRLATNSLTRDVEVCPETGRVSIDLLAAICITCEKKIIVPVQLCVLSTGFPNLSPEVSPICTTFPTLFPKQIDGSNEPSPTCPSNRFRMPMDANIESYDEF